MIFIATWQLHIHIDFIQLINIIITIQLWLA